jgi:hypothetical protein
MDLLVHSCRDGAQVHIHRQSSPESTAPRLHFSDWGDGRDLLPYQCEQLALFFVLFCVVELNTQSDARRGTSAVDAAFLKAQQAIMAMIEIARNQKEPHGLRTEILLSRATALTRRPSRHPLKRLQAENDPASLEGMFAPRHRSQLARGRPRQQARICVSALARAWRQAFQALPRSSDFRAFSDLLEKLLPPDLIPDESTVRRELQELGSSGQWDPIPWPWIPK